MRALFGIDVGKRHLHICRADTDEHQPISRWKVDIIDLTEPNWDRQLADLIPDGALIVAEPTGHHLLSPVATALRMHRPNTVICIINNEMTGNIRRSRVARAKTDAIDARALAAAATDIASGSDIRYPRSARLFEWESSAALMSLRLQLHSYLRHRNASTRCQNRLRIFGHSIWPALGRHLPTWLTCIAAGAIDPIQIKAWAANKPKEVNYRQWRYVEQLAEELPNIHGHPTLINTIRETYSDLRDAQMLQNRALLLLAEQLAQPQFAEIARLWSSVPGAAPQYIAALIVASNGLPAAMTRDQFKAAVGSSPITRQSGQKKSHDDRTPGYRPAKAAINLWAMWLVRPGAPNPIREAHARKGDWAATKAKLVRILYYIARSKQPYRYNPSTPENS